MEFWTIIVRDMRSDDGGYVKSLNEARPKLITETRDEPVLEYVAGYLSGVEGELQSIHKINTHNNTCTPYEVVLKANKLALQVKEDN